MKGSYGKRNGLVVGSVIFTIFLISGCFNKEKEDASQKKSIEIVNVSYDPTRELFEAYNKEFQTYWKEKTGQTVTIIQSHGGSGKQARSVIEGNPAEVVTLALEQDIRYIQKAGLIEKGWKDEFANDSAPYTSTVVFLVRKGNEKEIDNWDDLIKKGIEVITPNPKTSGGAKWNFLAAWGYAEKKFHGDEEKTKDFVKKLYKNVKVLDSGARAATTSFIENKQGDVLITWENEAYLSIQENADKYEIIVPPVSILALPTIAVVDEVTKERGTQKVAKEYLSYLYSDVAQRIIGEHFYRPYNKTIAKEYQSLFESKIEFIHINEFGGWEKAEKKFFQDGGIFDQIYY